MKFFSVRAIYFLALLTLPFLAISQTTSTNTSGSIILANTEAQFLNLTPDSRSGSMGEAGVAITPDVNATYWNPAKLAFLENDDDVSLSYSPWLRQLIPDISLSYLSYAHKIDARSSIGGSLRYFNDGSVPLTDTYGNNQGTLYPSEFSLSGSYSRKFGDEFSIGLTTGYIHSNFAAGLTPQIRAGNAISAGVSFFYTRQLQEFGTDGIFSFGTNISNIGSKISYSDVGTKYFLPANLKIGAADVINLDDYNQITIALDLNKLLTPTPPVMDGNGNIISGKDDNVSVPSGIFGSFTDAGGFNRQLQEFTISSGFEYWYNQLFAVRMGYFYHNPNAPNSVNTTGTQYLTLGVGFKYDEFNFDFSYIATSQQNSALANTLRFTLIANFGGYKNVNKK